MLQNILLIQSNPLDANSIRHALLDSSEGPFKVEWVGRFSEALERLASAGKQMKHGSTGIAAVLVDLVLPDSRGIETLDRLMRAAPQIPILVLCAPRDEDTARLAVQRGAQDYLLKDRLDRYLLPKAVVNMIERAANAAATGFRRARAP